MYIIVRKGEMPYYAGTDHNRVISWTSRFDQAKRYDWWISAQSKVNTLRKLTNDRTIHTKGQ